MPIPINAGSAKTAGPQVLLGCWGLPSCEGDEVAKAGDIVVVSIPQRNIDRCLSTCIIAPEY